MAHRVLSRLFQENPCQHPVVILRDAAFIDVDGLVRYIYRGEVDVKQDRLQSFLRTAELLKIKGLAEQNLSGHLALEGGGGGEQFQQQQLVLPGDIKREVCIACETIKDRNLSL